MRFAVPFLCALTMVAIACGRGGSISETQAASASTAEAGTTAAAAATPASDQAGTQLDVCALLTKVEVEAAVGTTVLAPKASQQGPAFDCAYSNPAVPSADIVRVGIMVSADAQTSKALWNLLPKPSNAVNVPGLGEVAYWEPITRSLNILRGKYDVLISVPPFVGGPTEGKDVKTIAQALAVKVLAKLP